MFFSSSDVYNQRTLITLGSIYDKEHCMENPHTQLIETICHDILPNMVRIFESNRMAGVLDQDQFVILLEQKVERANKSLKMLPVEDQSRFREMIDRAYADNIDRLRKQLPALQMLPVQNISAD